MTNSTAMNKPITRRVGASVLDIAKLIATGNTADRIGPMNGK